MDTFHAVQKAMSEEFVQIGPLPPFFKETVDLFSKAHLYYRSFKLGRAYSKAVLDPSKGNPVAYGAALHLVADHTSLNYALTAALAAKCAADLLREYRRVSESTQEFWQTVTCQYPLYQSVEWSHEKRHRPLLLLPSIYLLYQVKVLHLIKQLQKIAECIFNILWQTFKLSMSSADAYLILNGDPTARFESFTELVADWEDYEGQLEDSTQRLLEELEKGIHITDRILSYLKAQETCSTIIDNLKRRKGKASGKSEGFIDDLYDVAHNALDPYFIPGKVVQMHIDFSEGKAAPPALPKDRFPPWGGQKIEVIETPKKEPQNNWIEEAGEALFNNPAFPIATPLKGLQVLADLTMDLFADQFAVKTSANPFA